MASYILPRAGSRGRRVLDALFSFPAGPVEESALMARHYLNNCSASNWRKDTYQKLQDAYLITCHDSGAGSIPGATCWALTDKGARLLRAEQAAAVAAGQDAPAVVADNLAMPRTVRPFRPLAAGTVGLKPMRDGALDYQRTPSLMGGRRCA